MHATVALATFLGLAWGQPSIEPTYGGQLYAFSAFSTPVAIPDIVDLRAGGSVKINIGQVDAHSWGRGVPTTTVYGYGVEGKAMTHPGPTLLAKKGVPVSVEWINTLGSSKHLLGRFIEPSLLLSQSSCFPNCGIPVVTHVHGHESPPQFDGLPHYSIYKNQSFTARYNNNQSASTKVYHDHALGLSRLNMWAGLIGMYIIQDEALDGAYNLANMTDIPLILADKIIDPSGKLLYTSVVTCPIIGTLWMSESWGAVNTVNGVVMPYVEVGQEMVRFRVANMANSRHYHLVIPFADRCRLVATDSGYVGTPTPVNITTVLFSLERIELVCDFTGIVDGTTFEVTDSEAIDSSYTYDHRVFQVRVVAKSAKPSASIAVPTTMTRFKDLEQLYVETKGKLRTVTLGEDDDMNQCPTQSILTQYGRVANISTITNKLMCTRGKVEKWLFKNPTDDFHPFHWHLVNAQCGDSDGKINKNELKDVVVIPNAGSFSGPVDPTRITKVCYVACTPDDFLVQGSSRAAGDFGFDTTEPYLAHCHIMEHEDNSMMAWFQLLQEDDTNPVDDGTVASTSPTLTKSVIWTAIGMSFVGGMATTLSVLVISIPQLNFLGGDRALAMTFALSAGVMIFISFVDLFTESITSFKQAWAVGGSTDVDPELIENGLAPPGTVAPVCDPTCIGYSWLATTGCFYGGIVVIILLEILVHKVFDYHTSDLETLGDCKIDDDLEREIIIEAGASEVKTPTRNDADAPVNVEVVTDDTVAKKEFRRAGILTGIAIAIHNFPEGMALFVASLQGLKTGLVLAIGIILHNFPEGVAIAAPVYYATNSKQQAFLWTGLSGIAQPCGAFIGWATVAGGVTPKLSAVLYGLVSGMLVCIAMKELIPGAFKFGGHQFVPCFLVGVGVMALSLILLNFVGSS
ncbi:Zinc (Zn2)-Iron (Fe2) Permease (ZIP) Family [Achlya hypogyna]|uniref:Zinc (Zn2)-Iron (Fe2) Permease (ZIP) Family n=1 Tax=Achlya hypogyna TaxID=1202772 RepID=A0A1V9Z6T9_ACHHY|nr:Zinc (Zn2)-Iron (Fe2) Permease (ZIP) Family [Achlya hypogyna]